MRWSAPRPLLAAFLAAATLVSGFALGVVTPAPAAASTSDVVPGDAEFLFLKLHNEERVARGLRPLVLDPGVSSTSLTWSREMDRSNTLKHDPNLVARVSSVEPQWAAIGENVGVGWSVRSLHDAFMNSTGHRANILRSGYNRVGIGVVVEPDGRIWVTVRFLQGPAISGITGREAAGSTPPIATGDFNGDGRDDMFRHGPGSASDSTYFGTAAASTFTTHAMSLAGSYRPLAGDFNGDGRDDILLYGKGSMPDSLLRWNGSEFVGRSIRVGASFVPVVGDFDNDGRDDIFWYAPGTAKDYTWFGTSTFGTFKTYAKSVSGKYRPVSGDFNGDGRDDILWYAPGTASDTFWYGTGRNTFSAVRTSVKGTYAPTSDDYNGDGRDDIFWYAAGSTGDAVWYMNRTKGSRSSVAESIGGSFKPASADLNNDNVGDVIWWTPNPIDGDSVHFGTRSAGTFVPSSAAT